MFNSSLDLAVSPPGEFRTMAEKGIFLLEYNLRLAAMG
jgi:hypothetical protein